MFYGIAVGYARLGRLKDARQAIQQIGTNSIKAQAYSSVLKVWTIRNTEQLQQIERELKQLPELQLSGKSNKEILEEIWQHIRRISYTETQALNDKFIAQMVEAVGTHVTHMVRGGRAAELTSLEKIWSPIGHLLSEVKDGSLRASLIKKYEGIRAELAGSTRVSGGPTAGPSYVPCPVAGGSKAPRFRPAAVKP